MAEETLIRIVLAIIVGALFGIIYTMRVLVLMERRMARIEAHLDRLIHKILSTELKIEKRISKTGKRRRK